MRAVSTWACAVFLLGASAARADDRSSPSWAHIRPEQREDIDRRTGGLEQLPEYDLHLSVAADFSGYGLRERVTFTHRERSPLREVMLRLPIDAAPFADGRVPIVVSQGSCDRPCEVRMASRTTVRVALRTPLREGERLTIELDLQGQLEAIDTARTTMMAQAIEGIEGIEGSQQRERSAYGLLAHDDRTALLSSFYATLARRERGRWVLPAESGIGDVATDGLSNVRARIVVPRDVQVIATGAHSGSSPVRDPNGHPPRREHRFEAGAVREFAVVCGRDLESAERTIDGVAIRAFYRPEHRAGGIRALRAAASSFQTFERRFGPYPYTELDLVEAPLVGGAGGVEFSALITVATMFFRDDGSLGALGQMFGAGDATAEHQGAMLEFVTAHEVAHQWWHGLVGSDSRNDPWVDESLAQWSALYWVEDQYGAERALQEGERQVVMNYRAMRMMGRADGPVARSTSEFVDPLSYAGLVYGKGAYMFPALRRELGDEAFFAGLAAYVDRYRFSTAPSSGPIELLARGPRARAVRAIAHRWLEERHGDEDLHVGDNPVAELYGSLPPEVAGAMQDPEVQGVLQELLRNFARPADPNAPSTPGVGPDMLRDLDLGELSRRLSGLSGVDEP